MCWSHAWLQLNLPVSPTEPGGTRTVHTHTPQGCKAFWLQSDFYTLTECPAMNGARLCLLILAGLCSDASGHTAHSQRQHCAPCLIDQQPHIPKHSSCSLPSKYTRKASHGSSGARWQLLLRGRTAEGSRAEKMASVHRFSLNILTFSSLAVIMW